MYGSFNNSLARTESGGRYDVINSEGYGGKYQFGQDRLDDFNRANGTQYTVAQLVRDPSLQEYVQNWHVGDIDSFIVQSGLDKFIGQNINGTTITRDSMRAMAHLGGKGGMAKFLQSGGKYNPADSNGTRLSDYAKTHAGEGTRNSLSATMRPQEAPQNAMSEPKPMFRGNFLNAADFMVERRPVRYAGFTTTNPFTGG